MVRGRGWGVVGGKWEGHPVYLKSCGPTLEHYLVLDICPLVPIEVVHESLLQRLHQRLHGQWEGLRE